jgi:hypothetical protein
MVGELVRPGNLAEEGYDVFHLLKFQV